DNLRFALRSPRQFGDLPAQIPNVFPAHSQVSQSLNETSVVSIQDSLHAEAPRATDIYYRKGEEIATREVYGQVLAYLGNQNKLIYALDGDTKNSTFSQDFQKAHPNRFIECFIAEQNMAGVALGLSKRGKIPFVSTFAAFLTRAFDQIRMADQSKANIKFVGSHAGVSIGDDGASQMGLEDMAMFGTIPESVIFHPCDGVSTAKILPLMLKHSGISYLRTLRPKTPVIYKDDEKFVIGGSKILRQAQNDMLTVVAVGITVHEALKAYELLKKEGISIRVIDCYCVKPVDKETLGECINETKEPIIITVEDHYEHGGLGDFVLSAISSTGTKVLKMAVSKIPRSGTKDELLEYVGINAARIAEKVKSVL
ncbi:MAG: transketolase C-terminal domain-containing protein, partial [bacterium]|nr:transketolase C-terminal domain-containing protein [bacterium]